MVCALPLTNRKKFTRLSVEETVAFYEAACGHFTLLNELRSQAKARELCFPDLLLHLDRVVAKKPCSLVKLVFERVLFTDTETEQNVLLHAEPFEDFMRRYVFLLHPSAKRHQADQLWLDYFDKYLLMTKEAVLSSLRNTSRQRRGAKRFFRDLGILIEEGNYTDERLLNASNVQPRKHDTVALLLSINLTLLTMERYMSQAFALDMIKIEELQAAMMWTDYIYRFFAINGEPIASQHVEDLAKKGLVDIRDISGSSYKFQQYRKKLPAPMRLLFD